MVGKIKVLDKMIDIVKEYPKTTVVIVSTGVLIAGLILSGVSGPKEKYPYMPAPEVPIVVNVEKPVVSKNPNAITYSIKVAQNQIIRLEPRSDSKYVNKIDGNNDTELLYVDGNYALISYTDKNNNTRLGFVDMERVSHPENITSNYKANKLNMYGEIITNNCRIQNEAYVSNEDPNLLTRGKKGEFVKVIGSIKTGDKEWYIVIYRNYIGYINPENLNLMDEETFFNTINSSYVEIVGNKVRFRRSPKIDKNNIILEFDKGTKLPVISREGEWFQVYYDGEYGYVSTRNDCTREIFEPLSPPGLTQIHLDRVSGMII